MTDGAIISFAVQPDGSVKQVSQASSGGADPATLLVLSSGNEVVVADVRRRRPRPCPIALTAADSLQYSSGGILSFPIDADGVTLGDPAPILQLEGSGPVAGSQDVPHPHEIIEHGDELLVPDLVRSARVRRLNYESDRLAGL